MINLSFYTTFFIIEITDIEFFTMRFKKGLKATYFFVDLALY